MIPGSASWYTALAEQAKQPLYVFNIPNKAISLCSFFPLTIAANAGLCLPILRPIRGASQTVDELNGHTSISSFEVTAVDPSGALKSLSADPDIVGQRCQLLMGFPGEDVNDPTGFVPIHTGTIGNVQRSPEGIMSFTVQDTVLYTVDQIFLNGGPSRWLQWTSNDLVSLASDNIADTRVVTIIGWDASGTVLLEEAITLGGASQITSVNIFSFIVSIYANIASAQWTVNIRQGFNGVSRGTIPRGHTVIGGAVEPPTKPPTFLDNGYPVSDQNPRFISGNPIDILIATLQNEMGLGQVVPPLLSVQTGGGNGTGPAGFGINPSWVFYVTESPNELLSESSTFGLIFPNSRVDINALLALRNTDFAADRFEFKFNSSVGGKSWMEEQLMKVMGLYWITKANGQLTPKTMKQRANPTFSAIDDRQIIGIPQYDRWPVINIIQCTVPKSVDGDETVTLTFAQQASLDRYKNTYVHSINADGLRLGLGGYTRLYLLVNRIFNRHAFATPVYTFTTFIRNFIWELGDHFLLSHPLLLDLETGTLGITDVLCEIVERQPDYANGTVTFKVADTRFMSISNGAFEIAQDGAVASYPFANFIQQGQYLFISNSTGKYTTNIPANQID